MLKRLFDIFLIFLVSIYFSCKFNPCSDNDFYLIKRNIAQNLTNDLYIETIYFDIDNNSTQAFIFFNSNSNVKDSVYSLGCHISLKKIKAISDVPLIFEKCNNKKFVTVKIPNRQFIDTMSFFLYDIRGYKNVIGNVVKINNICI